MSRVDSGEMRNVNSALDTVNAAATAIASANSRLPPPSIQVRHLSFYIFIFVVYISKFLLDLRFASFCFVPLD